MEEKLWDMERHKEEYKAKYKAAQDQLNRMKSDSEMEKKNQEIESLKIELESKTHLLRSYEERNLKIAELERIIRNNNGKYEKKLQSIEENYNKKIDDLNNKILALEGTKATKASKPSSPFLVRNKEEHGEKFEFKLNVTLFSR